MATNLPPDVVATVKATIPVLEARGVDVIKAFYHTLFKKYPVSAGFFNRDRVAPAGSAHKDVPPQVAALGGAVIAYAKHIEDISPLLPVVERICHKHVSRGVAAPHYALVGECLLLAMADVLGPDVATEGVLSAWKAAYKHLADAFIGVERGIRDACVASGGYRGYAEFVIANVQPHAAGKTFTLRAADGGPPVPPHVGGQYVSFDLADAEGMGRCKTTAWLSDVRADALVCSVLPADERPTRHILAAWAAGDVVKASVPCGPYAADAGAVAGLTCVLVCGAQGDWPVMNAVANDVVKRLAKGVDKVTFVVEGEGEVDLPFAVRCAMEVVHARALTADVLKGFGAEGAAVGVFVAPSVRAAVEGLDVGYASVIE